MASTIYQARDGNDLAITSVIADNLSEARRDIAHELARNPSRIPYLRAWEAGGKRVKWVDDDGATYIDMAAKQ